MRYCRTAFGAYSHNMKVSDMPLDPKNPAKHINPETGIWPISEWGYGCKRGFVSDARFGSGQVIQRTNRETTRKWRRGSGASSV